MLPRYPNGELVEELGKYCGSIVVWTSFGHDGSPWYDDIEVRQSAGEQAFAKVYLLLYPKGLNLNS